MKTLVFFDIETGPSPTAETFKPVFEAPRNLKDPAKIAAAVEEKEIEWREKLALSAVTGMVLAIGYAVGEEEIQILHGDERETLTGFWDVLRELLFRGDHRLCGWNICGFDLPFLLRRSWALGIIPTDWVYHSGKLSFFHVDLMRVWCGENPLDRISLDTAAKFFGFPGKRGNGADFARLYEDDLHAALWYLYGDVSLSRDIAKKMNLL